VIRLDFAGPGAGLEENPEGRFVTYEVARDLLAACENAAKLYDLLAYGPLDGAAHFGPDWNPPSDEDCLAVRGQLDAAIAKAGETIS